MIALSDLITPMSTDQAQQTMIDGLVALGITSAPNWPKGAVSRSVLRVFAILFAAFTILIAGLASAGFRDLASGSWLTLWAKSVYNVTRPLATAAAGTVRISNAGGGSFTYGVGQVTVKNSATGVTYTNTAGFTLAAGPGTYVDVLVSSTITGAKSSSAPGAIDTLVTTMLSCSVTNSVSLVGTDDMSDADLGALCLAKLGALSPNGPADAYRYIAIADPTTVTVLVNAGLTTLTSVPVSRVGVVADGNGGVSVYLANAAGPASVADVAIVNARIQAAATPLGIKVTCYAATPVTVPVSYSAWAKGTGLTLAGVTAALNGALAAYFSTVPLGGVVLPPSTGGALSPNALELALGAAVKGIQKAQITSPGADLPLTPDQVPVLGAVTASVTIL